MFLFIEEMIAMFGFAFQHSCHAFAASASAAQASGLKAGFLDRLEQRLVIANPDFKPGALQDRSEWNAAGMAASE